jgi:putative ATP-dependent endonuclease of OLD family
VKIKTIRISNFRSIANAEFDTVGFNVFVGQNNHGKTNLFQAVEWFYSAKGEIGQIRNVSQAADSEVSVEIVFSGVQDGLNQITHSDNQTKLRTILGDLDEMRIRRTSEAPKERFIFHPARNEWKKQPCGADSAFNNCIPRFEFVEATKNLKDVGGYKSTSPIGKMLGGVLTEILEADQNYREFREKFEALFGSETSAVRSRLTELGNAVQTHLAKQFPDCTAVDFAVEEPAFDDLLKNFSTRLDDGVNTTAEEKGDGMQRALMLAIIKTYADRRREEALGRSFIFFIDEAELHLHPTAQRQLKEALLELADGHDQVFVNTHSSVLLADDHQSQRVFRVHKEVQGLTTVESVNSGTAKYEVVYELLGGSPADILLPSNFLIVEGCSEQEFLKAIIRRFYGEKPPIHVLAANGDDEKQRQSYGRLNDTLHTLGGAPIYRDKLVILLDQPDGPDKQARFKEFKRQNYNLVTRSQLVELQVHGLEDYYPADLRAATGLGPNNKVRMAKKVAETLTKERFETEMSLVFQALSTAWKNAYQDQTPMTYEPVVASGLCQRCEDVVG